LEGAGRGGAGRGGEGTGGEGKGGERRNEKGKFIMGSHHPFHNESLSRSTPHAEHSPFGVQIRVQIINSKYY
jgi:hypothetical protein